MVVGRPRRAAAAGRKARTPAWAARTAAGSRAGLAAEPPPSPARAAGSSGRTLHPGYVAEITIRGSWLVVINLRGTGTDSGLSEITFHPGFNHRHHQMPS